MIDRLLEPSLILAQFRLPPQDISLLSFCASKKPAHVAQWADQLRLTQIKATSAELYKAVPEIAHLKTDVKSRFEMLEAVWPAVQHVVLGLAKDFLNQSLMMPEAAQKSAIVAQALEKHLLDGYTLCAKELADQKRLKPAQQDILLTAIYRGISCASLMMLRNFQLYTGIPAGLWSRLHGLWQAAEYYELLSRPVPAVQNDPASPRTVNDAYLRIVSLACVRPNQLPQNDIATAFQALGPWSRQIKLHDLEPDRTDRPYCINLNSDAGPVARDRLEANPTHRLVELDFNGLVQQLDGISGRQKDEDMLSSARLTVPAEMQDTLLAHVVSCLSSPVQRFQQRRRADIEAEACVGLIDCHFHICGGVSFDQFVNPRTDLADEGLVSDTFSSLIDSLTRKKDIDEAKPAKQTVFGLTIQNVSAGGYCALWQGELPSRAEAGEVIGLRERGRRSWSVGVIRWIRQTKSGSQLGIQLLTSQPVPFGAAVTYDLGGYSDYMRAIHIPNPTQEGQPPALLTSAVPFQENARARLKQDDAVTEVRLTRCVFSTSKIKLFSFDSFTANE